MTTAARSTALVTIQPAFTDPERLALAGFLAGYRDLTPRGLHPGPAPVHHLAALDAEVPLRDVQEAASHADPRTTMRHDRARGSLDRHATYIVAAYVAGAAR